MTESRRQQLEARRAELKAQHAARRDLDKCLRFARFAVFTPREIAELEARAASAIR